MCKWRHLVENFFQRLKEFRRIATPYDNTIESVRSWVEAMSSRKYLDCMQPCAGRVRFQGALTGPAPAHLGRRAAVRRLDQHLVEAIQLATGGTTGRLVP